MNYRRLALSMLAATAVDIIYGFAVYGTALASEIGIYGGVFRSIDSVNDNLPWLVGGLLLSMFAATWIYAQGCRGEHGLSEGLRFGAVMGLFVVGYVAVGNYVVTKIGRRLAVYMAAAGFVEWIVVGIAIGLVYKPPAPATSQRP